MLHHGSQLSAERCPHCSVAKPVLQCAWSLQTTDHSSQNHRFWACYVCTTCGGIALAVSHIDSTFPIIRIWPDLDNVSEVIPERARDFLRQAIVSIHSPAGAVMLAASAVDAMLKAKGYKDGNLYPRIEQAAKDHLITAEMADWAHEIRLEANDHRHADEEAPLPNEVDATKAVEFAKALAQFMFVLPARVERGRKNESIGIQG